MKKKKRRLLVRTIILSILFSAVGYTMYAQFFAEKEKVVVGEKAPDFVLEDLNGEKHKLSDYEGKGVFLNFWGTWCKPCAKEMPVMQNQYEQFKDKGVEILAVNADETELAVNRFSKSYGLTFPVMIDDGGEVQTAYDIGPLPTTILIDSKGEIVDIFEGGLDEQKIKEYMNNIKP
ncbi:thiol-disulfide oxidoreductase ResA [Bacillus sp. JZ8]